LDNYQKDSLTRFLEKERNKKYDKQREKVLRKAHRRALKQDRGSMSEEERTNKQIGWFFALSPLIIAGALFWFALKIYILFLIFKLAFFVGLFKGLLKRKD